MPSHPAVASEISVCAGCVHVVLIAFAFLHVPDGVGDLLTAGVRIEARRSQPSLGAAAYAGRTRSSHAARHTLRRPQRADTTPARSSRLVTISSQAAIR